MSRKISATVVLRAEVPIPNRLQDADRDEIHDGMHDEVLGNLSKYFSLDTNKAPLSLDILDSDGHIEDAGETMTQEDLNLLQTMDTSTIVQALLARFDKCIICGVLSSKDTQDYAVHLDFYPGPIEGVGLSKMAEQACMQELSRPQQVIIAAMEDPPDVP